MLLRLYVDGVNAGAKVRIHQVLIHTPDADQRFGLTIAGQVFAITFREYVGLTLAVEIGLSSVYQCLNFPQGRCLDECDLN
jgi:hypothetical protein